MTARWGIASVAAVSLLFSSIALADPQPGTPGNSGNQNPHGTPPGQGGSAPGNSAGGNPHGTPPGQRICPPGPAATPANPGESRRAPAVQGSRVNPGFECPPHCDAGKGMAEYEEAARLLSTVVGWEPDWRVVGESLDPIALEATTREIRGAGIREWKVKWTKAGSRERGAEAMPEGDLHEWLLLPGVQWSRWGKGPWQEAGLGPSRSALGGGRSLVNVIEVLWQATPLGIVKRASGTITVEFLRHRGQGRMTWEVEGATRLLGRVRMRDALGNTEWEEARGYGRIGGRQVLQSRDRRGPGITIAERLIWAVPSAAEAEAALAEPPR